MDMDIALCMPCGIDGLYWHSSEQEMERIPIGGPQGLPQSFKKLFQEMGDVQ